MAKSPTRPIESERFYASEPACQGIPEGWNPRETNRNQRAPRHWLDGCDAKRCKGAGDAIGVRQGRQREHRLVMHGRPPPLVSAAWMNGSVPALTGSTGKPAAPSPLNVHTALKLSLSAGKAPPKALPAGYFDKRDAAGRRGAQSVVRPGRTLSRDARPQLSNAVSRIE